MKTTNLAVAIAAVLAGAMTATVAQATPGATAESSISVSSFKISQGGTQIAVSQLDLLNATTEQKSTAGITSAQSGPVPTTTVTTGIITNSAAPSSTTNIQPGIGAVSPAVIANELIANQAINAASVTPVTFDVIPFTTPGVLPFAGNYAAAATNDLGTPITGVVGNTMGSNGSFLNSASYAALIQTGQASANTNSSLTSKFSFTSASGVFDINFNIAAYLADFLSLDDGIVAKSGLSLNFELIDNTTFTGALNAASNALINPFTNQYSLSVNKSNNKPGTGDISSSFFTTGGYIAQGLQSVNLLASHTYTLTSTITTDAYVAYVPEPGIVALIGIGLLGLGVASSRKSA